MMRSESGWRGAAFLAVAVACLVLAGLFSPVAMAQDTMQVIQNSPGFKAAMTYSSFGNGENVNVLSGALIVTHPSALSLPQNHGGMLSFARVYNDRNEESVFGANGLAGGDPQYGFTGKCWRIGFGRVICRYINQSVCDSNGAHCVPAPVLHCFYVDESGAEHALFPVANGNYYTNDGSYLRAHHSINPDVWTIYYPDGSKRILEHFIARDETTLTGGFKYVTNWAQEGWYATKLYDSFSNLIQITYNDYDLNTQPFGDSIATITDQFNRVITFHSDPGTHLLASISWLGVGGQTVEEHYEYGTFTDQFSDPDWNKTCPYLIKYTDPAGLEVRYSYQWHGVGSNDDSITEYVLSSIAYPTGAIAQYSYGAWRYWTLPPDLPWHGDPDGNPHDVLMGAGVVKRTLASGGNSLSWNYRRGEGVSTDPDLTVGNFVILSGPDGRAETHRFYYSTASTSSHWMDGRELEVDQYSHGYDSTASTHPGLAHSKTMAYEYGGGDAELCLTDDLSAFMPPGWPPPIVTVAMGGNARVYQTVEKEYDPSTGAQLSQRTTTSTGWDGYGHYTQTETTGTGIVGPNHPVEFSGYHLSLQTAQTGLGSAYNLNMKTASASGWGQIMQPPPGSAQLTALVVNQPINPPPPPEAWQGFQGTIKVRRYIYNDCGALTQARYKKPQYTLEADYIPGSDSGIALLLHGVPNSLQAGDVATTVSYYPVGDIAAGNIQSVSYSGGDAPQGGGTITFTQNFTWDHGMVSSAQTEGISYADLTRTIDQYTSLITSTTDPNNITTNFTYDILGRLTTIAPQDGDYSTYISYPTSMASDDRTICKDILFYQGPSGYTPSLTDDVSGIDAGAAYAHYIFDDLGRLVETRSLHPADSDNPNGYLTKTVTAYDPWGAAFFTSLPFRDGEVSFQPLDWSSKVGAGGNAFLVQLPMKNGSYYGSASSIYSSATFADLLAGTPDPFNRALYSFKPNSSYVSTAYAGLRTDVTLHNIMTAGGPADSTTVYTKDILGRLLLVQPPAGASALYSYDALGNMVQTDLLSLDTDSSQTILTSGVAAFLAGKTTQRRSFVYDGLGRLRSATNPENGTTNFTAYAPLGKLLEAQDANGAAATTPYRLRSTYDPAGRLLATNKVKASDGSLIQALIANTYDKLGGAAQGASLGQLVQAISYQLMQSGTTATTSDSYVYSTTTGRVSSITQSTNAGGWAEPTAITPTYDLYGQVTDQALPPGTIHNTFSHGAVMSRILSGDNRTLLDQFVYNEAGSLSSVRLGQSYAQSVMYDETLRPIGFALGTPTAPANFLALGSYADPTNPATRQQHEASAYRYQYDGAGNITSIGETAGVTDAFTYDKLSRLTGAAVYKAGAGHNYGYTYDPYGNLTQRTESANGQANVKSYLTTNCLMGSGDAEGYLRELMFSATIVTANGAPTNRLASVQRGGTIGGIPTGISQTNTAVSYDANGNMTNDGQHVYRYDALNRQIAVLLLDGTTKLAESVYNSSGERVAMVNYQGGAVTGFTKFLRDGAAVVYEKCFAISGSSHLNKSEKTYLYGAGRMAVTKDTNLVSGVSTYTYYGVDHLGTVRYSKTINSSGLPVAGGLVNYAFEPFGVMIPGQSVSISPNGNTHLYTGHERDTLADGSNMDYMHFRFFSASMGRFQKPDSNFDNPGANPQGWNLYSYVKGNPVNFNDPTGHVVRTTASTMFNGYPGNPIGQSMGAYDNGWWTTEDSLTLTVHTASMDSGGQPAQATGQAAPKAQTSMFGENPFHLEPLKLDSSLSSDTLPPLVQAQDAALTNDDFAPRGGKTFCNYATLSIVTAMGADTTPFHYWDNGGVAQANDFLRYETTEGGKHAGQWKGIPAGEVQSLADKGQLVVGVRHGGNHGHLVTARPSWAATQGYADALRVTYKEGGTGPYIANIGAGEPWIGRAQWPLEWFVPAP